MKLTQRQLIILVVTLGLLLLLPLTIFISQRQQEVRLKATYKPPCGDVDYWDPILTGPCGDTFRGCGKEEKYYCKTNPDCEGPACRCRFDSSCLASNPPPGGGGSEPPPPQEPAPTEPPVPTIPASSPQPTPNPTLTPYPTFTMEFLGLKLGPLPSAQPLSVKSNVYLEALPQF